MMCGCTYINYISEYTNQGKNIGKKIQIQGGNYGLNVFNQLHVFKQVIYCPIITFLSFYRFGFSLYID